MGKISPVAAKYIVHATIDIDGVVDRPDVIGAIFGQTEGLLGSDLELRELQRSGRIGRIEVTTDTRSGKTHGSIDIPSSLDKAETLKTKEKGIVQHAHARILTQFSTENLKDIEPGILIKEPSILAMLRMATAPPIARDRLTGLAGVSRGLVHSMEVDKVVPPRMMAGNVETELRKIAQEDCPQRVAVGQPLSAGGQMAEQRQVTDGAVLPDNLL
jgi:hypothetical protein